MYCGGVYYGVLLLLCWRFWFIDVMFIVMLVVVVCPAHVYGSVAVVVVLMFLMVVYSFGYGVL